MFMKDFVFLRSLFLLISQKFNELTDFISNLLFTRFLINIKSPLQKMYLSRANASAYLTTVVAMITICCYNLDIAF